MSRIKLTDTPLDMVVKMADGNVGAVDALTQIIQRHDDIDPQGALGGIGAILILDTWEIYGSRIHILFSYKCGKDVRKMLMLMRSVQLGFLSQDKLKNMATDERGKVNLTNDEWNDLDKKVCKQLVDFQRAA